MQQVQAHDPRSVLCAIQVDPQPRPQMLPCYGVSRQQLRVAADCADHADTFAQADRDAAIGVAVPDISDPLYAEIARGVSEVAEAEGYSVLLGNTQDDPKVVVGMLQDFYSPWLARSAA